MNEFNEYYDWLVYNKIATEEEIRLVGYIHGFSIETLGDILFVKTGYRSREQYESENIDWEEA